METCCGCMNLKQGSIASAIWSMIIGTLVLGLYGYLLSVMYQAYDDPSVYGFRFYLYWAEIAVMSLWILFSILLIIGVVKGIRGMFLPWMILTVVFIVLEAINLIQYFLVIALVFTNPITAVAFILAVVIVLVNIYAMVCVSAHYRQLSTVPGSIEMQPHYPGKHAI
ncbi:uncharacterized protein LOC106180440 [Lingula anatina]|uniref:Uncharacterized protein LOC106180440 n=1 Tax=Lingula anatina TaxID=7574 RepID=A0A1S3KC91_LINAN|nr:uncharacterized protein LOC106180440 [Lingula anatina]|eukprot:XP_013419876.1 uncharacterized protein LOC106180440 [Lingula anatina]